MKSLSRLTRSLLLCVAGLSCAPDTDPGHRTPPSELAPRGALAQGVAGGATYEVYWEAPGCTTFNEASCGTTSALIGRGTVGPEPYAPNTLYSSKCEDGNDGLFHADGSVEALHITTLDGRSWLAENSLVKLDVDVWGAPEGVNTLMLFSADDASNPRWVQLATLPVKGGPETLSHLFKLPTGARVQAVRAALVDSTQAEDQPCTPGRANDHDDLVFRVAPEDMIPPFVVSTSPFGEGETVAGVVTLKAVANDNQVMDRVDFLINGVLVGSDATVPYELNWDSASVSEGQTLYELQAWDAVGNQQIWSGSLNVRHDHAAPTVQLVSPQQGSQVRGQTELSIDASDDVGISRFEFHIDGTLVISPGSYFHNGNHYSYTWDTRETASGLHTLKARVYDLAGKVATTQEVSFTVDHPPTVSLSAPTPGSTVEGDVVISADATDDMGVREVSFYVNNQWLGSDTVPPFSLTWQSAQFANGNYTVKAVADDGTSTATSILTVTVDNDKAPPTVAFTSPTPGATVQGTVTLAANASDARSGISQVQFLLASNNQLIATDTTAPYSYDLVTRYIANGPLTLLARATDGKGNVSTTSVTVTVDNDRTPPTVAFTSPAPGATVQGLVTLAVNANDTQSGVARVDFLQGNTTAAILTHAPYTYTLDTKYLPNGPLTLSARVWDGESNLSETSILVTVDNDRTPPTVAITSPANGATVEGIVTLTVDASDARSGISQVQFFRDSILVGSDTSAPYTYEVDTTALANGTVSYTAKALDGADNWSTSSVTFTVDNDKVAPTVAITSPAQGATVQGLMTLKVDASDARSGISQVQFYLASSNQLLSTDTTVPYSYEMSTRYIPNGPLTLLAKAIDGKGNASTTSVTVTVDNDRTPPTVSFTSPADGASVQGTVTVTMAASDARSGVARVDFLQANVTVSTLTSPPYTHTLNTRDMPNGPLALKARAWDGENNLSETSITIMVDNDKTPPTVAITSPANGATVQGTVTVTADASDARSGITQVQFLRGSSLVGVDTSAPYTYDLNSALLPNGSVTLTAKALDGVGNSSTSSVTVTVDNDKTPPTVAFTSPTAGATVQGTLRLAADASDARSAIAQVQFYLASNNQLLATDTTAPYSYDLATRNLPNGSLTFLAKATDTAGNAGTTSVTVTVDNDKTPPTVAFTSPTDGATLQGLVTLAVDASDARSGVTRVDFLQGNVTIATDTTAPYSYTLDSRYLANGPVTLSAKAWDAESNLSMTSIAVTIDNDKVAPTVAITSPAQGATVEGNVTLAVDASDARSGISQVLFYAGNSLVGTDTSAPYSWAVNTRAYGNGALSLTARARDGAGNESTASVSVTVDNDVVAPTVSITSPTTNTTVSGTVQIAVSASDARSGVSRVEFYVNNDLLVTDTTAPFTIGLPTRNYPNGTYTLGARALDGQGNSSSASVSVTFNNDFAPPTVSITNPVNNAALNAGTTYSFNALANDNFGVSRVDFHLDGKLLSTSTTAPYTVNWTPSADHIGGHTLSASAYDAVDNRSTTSVNFTVVNAAPPSSGSFSYNATNTNSATANTANKTIALLAGQRLTLGTCGVTGASFSGDTYLRLHDPSGAQVAFNDDACGGVGSNFVYTVPTGASGDYQLRAGCYSNGTCGGTVTWTLQ